MEKHHLGGALKTTHSIQGCLTGVWNGPSRSQHGVVSFAAA